MDNASKPVYCVETNTTYPSKQHIVTHLGVKYMALRNVLAGAAKTVKGMHFENYDPAKHPKPLEQ